MPVNVFLTIGSAIRTFLLGGVSASSTAKDSPYLTVSILFDKKKMI